MMQSAINSTWTDRIREWAAGEPTVLEVYVFGSHAKRTPTAGSDLDLAVKIDSPADALIADWMFSSKDWKRTLTSMLGVTVDLDLYDRENAPNVYSYVQEASVLIYKRPH